MRKIALLIALTTLGTLAGPLAAPASAGPIRDQYDAMRYSSQGEEFCAGLRFVGRQFSDQPKVVRTSVRLLVNRFFGCDANGSEFWYGVDDAVFGPIEDLSDAVHGGACFAYDAIATEFERQAPTVQEPFRSVFSALAEGLRIVEGAHCHGTLPAVPPLDPGTIPPPSNPVDVAEALALIPHPKSQIPAEMVVLYDFATVFPCALGDALAKQFPTPIGADLMALYDWLDCAENQFLPPSS